MYDSAQLRRGLGRGLRNPAFFGRELNRLYHRRLYQRQYNADGVDVMAQDWDVLVVLDGCRYDIFEQRHDLPGRLEARQSRGSHTVEFLQGNVAGRDLRDTVYVTASPQLHRHRDRLNPRFHAVVDVWRGEGWNDEQNTVLPKTMTDAVRDAREQFPNKRLVAHYLQPHYPFIQTDVDVGGDRLADDDAGVDVWGQLMRGRADVTADEIWTAYRRNLDAVLPYVNALRKDLSGKLVVTADHGNMFDEQAFPVPIHEWGHPPGVHTPELVTVPWLVSEGSERPEIVAGEENIGATTTDDGVTDRLRHLGYAEQ